MQVLVIDDAQINVTLLCRLLDKLEHCSSLSFLEPERALEWCESHIPDLVLVDYMMPSMNGIEFIRRFRAFPRCKDIPILMITANDEVALRYEALEVGANDFLIKPVDRIEFLARTKNMLTLRSHQRMLEDRAEWLNAEVLKATEEIRAREQETILRLSKAADSRDPETGAHIVRMANYSRLIAEQLGCSLEEQQMLLEAAPMHDIGKVGIPDHILLKPGKLTPEEFSIMKSHALLGFQILDGSASSTLQMGAQIALSHHEKYDGSGYPQGLIGTQIPLVARIVAVADVFDALTSERPYKPAWPIEQALDLLREGREKHFDPECVDAFLARLTDVMTIREKYQEDKDDLKRFGSY
ncbi:HD domain-containing phosphohydrolase [Undibacterium fentianense]|uniref:Response regulator n=1 Tax=Undibacterium fentianense TaxID=2828728 RepID=A0A941DXR3_9BURK|nr:HD domain-containing phosphohydrolase [Undibacterium fentianense]MBR7799389.1 response regulator [Undibacterium fentianense]